MPPDRTSTHDHVEPDGPTDPPARHGDPGPRPAALRLPHHHRRRCRCRCRSRLILAALGAALLAAVPTAAAGPPDLARPATASAARSAVGAGTAHASTGVGAGSGSGSDAGPNAKAGAKAGDPAGDTAGGAATTAPADAWHAPVAGPVTVVRRFDLPAEPWLAGHRGVDLAAAPGSTVLAPRSGTVTFAGTVVDRPVVTIQHDDGLRTSLEPVHAGVDVGSRVVAGAPVGTLSTGGHATSTGRDATESCAPESCVHWGVRRGEDYLDPMALLHPGPVVLLSSARVDGSRPGAHPRHDVLTGTTDPGRARRVSRGPPR